MRAQNPFVLFERALRRHAVASPEGKLFVAVIAQAAKDAIQPDKAADPIEANRFFYDGRMFEVADSIGLNRQVVQEFYERLYDHVKGNLPLAA